MSEWKTIESAPRDGRSLLLGRQADDGDDVGFSTLGWWEEPMPDGPDYMGHDGGFTDYNCADFRPGRSFGNPQYMYEARQPTHWMPLPSPPTPEAQS